jgi:outer membrane protein assembly factor BamD (BamD/ComL family)
VKRLISILIILTASALYATAQQPVVASGNEIASAQLDALRRSGVEALYNLDYDKAQRDFKEIGRLYPNHPAGPQLQSFGT